MRRVPRLWHAVRRNFGDVPGLLDGAAQVAAWDNGDHASVLWSLTEQVTGIVRLLERARVDRFISGAGEPTTAPTTGPPLAHRGAVRALLRGNVTASPGPDIWLQPAVFDPKRLSDRHCAVLSELFKHGAHDFRMRLTTEQIVRAVDGPDPKVASFNYPISQLREWGCVETVTGRGGGVWLTEAGSALAEIHTK